MSPTRGTAIAAELSSLELNQIARTAATITSAEPCERDGEHSTARPIRKRWHYGGVLLSACRLRPSARARDNLHIFPPEAFQDTRSGQTFPGASQPASLWHWGAGTPPRVVVGGAQGTIRAALLWWGNSRAPGRGARRCLSASRGRLRNRRRAAMLVALEPHRAKRDDGNRCRSRAPPEPRAGDGAVEIREP